MIKRTWWHFSGNQEGGLEHQTKHDWSELKGAKGYHFIYIILLWPRGLWSANYEPVTWTEWYAPRSQHDLWPTLSWLSTALYKSQNGRNCNRMSTAMRSVGTLSVAYFTHALHQVHAVEGLYLLFFSSNCMLKFRSRRSFGIMSEDHQRRHSGERVWRRVALDAHRPANASACRLASQRLQYRSKSFLTVGVWSRPANLRNIHLSDKLS